MPPEVLAEDTGQYPIPVRWDYLINNLRESPTCPFIITLASSTTRASGSTEEAEKKECSISCPEMTYTSLARNQSLVNISLDKLRVYVVNAYFASK